MYVKKKKRQNWEGDIQGDVGDFEGDGCIYGYISLYMCMKFSKNKSFKFLNVK